MRGAQARLVLLVSFLAGPIVGSQLGAQAAGAAQGAGATQGAGSRRAFLVRGAAPVRGLPFFAPNVLPALSGSYALGASAKGDATFGGPELNVWYTREPLVLGGTWKRATGFGDSAFLLARSQGEVLVMKTARYHLFFELPTQPGTAAADQDRRAFIRAFDRKFSAFFDNAANDAELSFPAFVDY